MFHLLKMMRCHLVYYLFFSFYFTVKMFVFVYGICLLIYSNNKLNVEKNIHLGVDLGLKRIRDIKIYYTAVYIRNCFFFLFNLYMEF